MMEATATVMHPETGDPESAAEIKERRDEERRLIQACQEGDLDAFGDLVRRYEKKVYWIAFNLVGDAEDAQDLAQEAFLRVFKAIERFKLQYNFYTWLYRIVVNLAIDHLRKHGKQQKVSLEECPVDPPTFAGPERHLENIELESRIQSVLDSLPPKYKTVIVLRDIHEMPCAEISKIIHCTNATTRWRLHKAREMFKERWGQRAPEEGIPA
jgi:RNA polymerase sigma-70 factor (ECF subfamily)